MFGCRLPSPAWKTFERRRPWRVGDRADALEHLGQLGARHHGVVHVEIGREATHRAEGALARSPEALALGGVARDVDAPVACSNSRDLANALDLSRDSLRHAVQFDEQHGTGVARQAGGVDARLDRLDRAAIDDLHRGRHEPAADDASHCTTRRHHVAEDGEQRFDGFGNRREAHGDLGDDAERALGADDGAEQVGSVRHAGRRAESHHLAVGKHELHGEHVVGRGAVLQRVRSAGVLTDVAADRARELAGRVGRVEEPVRLDHLRKRRVDDAGLHDGNAIRDGTRAARGRGASTR